MSDGPAHMLAQAIAELGKNGVIEKRLQSAERRQQKQQQQQKENLSTRESHVESDRLPQLLRPPEPRDCGRGPVDSGKGAFSC